MPVEMPPRFEKRKPPSADEDPRLVAPPVPRTPLPRLVVRIAVGSIGLSLAIGVVVGRMTAVESARPVSETAPTELRIRGAGHLAALPGLEISGSGNLLADAAEIRSRLLATGLLEHASVERMLPGNLVVDVEEKRAVAFLDWEPPAALAADGTVLGPATAADLVWAGAPDLVLVRGAGPAGVDVGARAALAGRLGTALRGRPDLDRRVSEVDVSGGPYRLRVVLRSPPLPVLLTERDFVEGLDRVARHLPDLIERWPDLVRVDARVPDRFLVRTQPAAAPPDLRVHPAEGHTQ